MDPNTNKRSTTSKEVDNKKKQRTYTPLDITTNKPSTSNKKQTPTTTKKTTECMIVRTEPPDKPANANNVQKMTEIVDFFRTPDISNQKLYNDDSAIITIHTEGLSQTQICQLACALNVKKITETSTHKSYTKALIQFKSNTLNSKLNLPLTLRNKCNTVTLNDLLNNAETTKMFDQATQVCYNDIVGDTILNNEEENNILNQFNNRHMNPINNRELIRNEVYGDDTLPQDIKLNKRAIYNFTKITIPTNVAHILSLGPKFAPPVTENDKAYEKIEKTARFLNEAYGNPLTTEQTNKYIKETINNFRFNIDKHINPIIDFYEASMDQTAIFLQENNEITITQADKGRATVVMYTEDYKDKVIHHLNDKSTYQDLNISSVNSYKEMNRKYLDWLETNGYINKNSKKSALTNETKIANFYAFIKTHKKEHKIRPICNTINTPGYTIANTLTPILTRSMEESTYAVPNSLEAKNIIDNASITPSMYFTSFDVVSMFTNITFEDVEKVVRKKYQQKRMLTKIPCEIMLKMLKFICSINTEFKFNKNLYKQIKGLRMGSSISPVLASMVMEDTFDRVFSRIEKPEIFMIYVDDVLTATTKKHTEELFKEVNNTNQNIKFEMETEINNEINYLDMTVHNAHNTTVTTKWFQKEMASKVILNYHSQHDPQQINNTAIAYVTNMYKITDDIYWEEITDKAKEILKINAYPEENIQKTIRIAKYKISKANTSTNTQSTQETPDRIYAKKALPHINHLSQDIRHTLQSSIKEKTNKEHNTTVVIAATTATNLNQTIFNSYKDSNQ